MGDTEEQVAAMVKRGLKFDLINLNNVLEHLLNPVETMHGLYKLLTKTGCLRVQVPNDFSALQKLLIEKKMIDREFWVAPHEHMNYFERDSLKNIFKNAGFAKVEALADYPIDLSLLNPDTNYVMDKTKGKNCHWARVAADNFLARKSVQDLVTFRRGCGESGLGRNVIVYGRP
jgi:predicted SAM-dependent methyltransferase